MILDSCIRYTLIIFARKKRSDLQCLRSPDIQFLCVLFATLEDKHKSESKSTFLFLVQTSKPLNSFGQSSVDRNTLIEILIQNFLQNYSTVLSTFYFTANAFRIIFQIKKNRGGKVWRGGHKEVFCYACPHPHPIFLLIKMCYFIIVNY